jgi:hypothetical protein
MPRSQLLICSGVCFLICSFTTAQSLPKKNASIQQVVSYQVYQQKQWNYNQLPKKSIQYRLDPKYIPLSDKKNSSAKLNLSPVKAPDVKKNFSEPYLPLQNNSKFYQQNSRFLKYMWPNQNREQSFLNNLGHSL